MLRRADFAVLVCYGAVCGACACPLALGTSLLLHVLDELVSPRASVVMAAIECEGLQWGFDGCAALLVPSSKLETAC